MMFSLEAALVRGNTIGFFFLTYCILFIRNLYILGGKMFGGFILYFCCAENYKHKTSRIKVSKKQKQKVMSNLKQGQKVFDYILQEWLTISEINEKHKYSIKTSCGASYAPDAAYSTGDKLPRLSLTEWNPIEGTGVFTPIDQEPPLQMGDMVYVWDREGGAIFYGELVGIDIGADYSYLVKTKWDKSWWRNVSKKRPYWIP